MTSVPRRTGTALRSAGRRLSVRPGEPRRRGRLPVRLLLVWLVLALLSPLALTHADVTSTPVRASGAPGQPNVVVIITDDQRTDSLMSMPAVKRLLVDEGTNYPHAYVPTGLCCPSRSTILTGLYSHDTKVWQNSGAYGGYGTFRRHGNEKRTIAVKLHRAGYRTALVGKYLNHFGQFTPRSYKPRGWDIFQAFRNAKRPGAYYNYRLGQHGKKYGHDASDYSTDVLTRKAIEAIWSTPRKQSLFLYFAVFSPHNPYDPAPRDEGALAGKLPSFQPPSVTAPVDDKPAWVQAMPQVPQDVIDQARERQGESLMAVDDSVAALTSALRRTGRLRDTMILFMSDNGLQMGEHHIMGKNSPYLGTSSVPLVIRWDGHVPAGATDNRFAMNVDLAQTIADAADVPMKTDGLSLLGSRTRDGALVEATPAYRTDRPAYCGYRTVDWLYVRYATGEEELYDYTTDPWELHNLADDPAYRQRLATMKADAVRTCDPVPPGFTWS